MDNYKKKIKKDSCYQLEKVFNRAAFLENLQMVLQEFDPAATSNKKIMIQYFRKGLGPFIRAQLDARGRELDSWEEAIENVIDIEIKAFLQLLSGTWEINGKCFQGYKPAKKEDKNSGKSHN